MATEKLYKYEKPISLDAGKVASILGANCSYGDTPEDACIDGYNPAIQSVCTPSGSTATNNCENGTSAGKSCGSGDSPGWGCHAGTSPS